VTKRANRFCSQSYVCRSNASRARRQARRRSENINLTALSDPCDESQTLSALYNPNSLVTPIKTLRTAPSCGGDATDLAGSVRVLARPCHNRYLTDLLVDTVHRINAKADRRVSEALLDDPKRVTGRTNVFFALADATLAQPNGVVRDVVFSVVSEATLQALVKEWKATGPGFRNTLRGFIRNSYKSHLPASGPRASERTGVPLEQRGASPRHPRARGHQAVRGDEAAQLPDPGKCAARFRTATLARCRR
jgi:hypothetical protein